MNAEDWERNLILFKISLKSTVSLKPGHTAERNLHLTRFLSRKTAHDKNLFYHQRDVAEHPQEFCCRSPNWGVEK